MSYTVRPPETQRIFAELDQTGFFDSFVRSHARSSNVTLVGCKASIEDFQQAFNTSAELAGVSAPKVQLNFPLKGRAVVCSLIGETELATQSPASVDCKRLLADIFVQFCATQTSDPQHLRQDLLIHSVGPERIPNLYLAVLCSPRSGSSLLCDLIDQTELLGQPLEHLSDAILSLTEFTDFPFTEWLTASTVGLSGPSGVFSTKLINDRFFRCMRLWGNGVLEMPSIAFNKLRVVRLRRRDLPAQAVSIHLAAYTNVYFETSTTNAQSRAERLKHFVYNFDELKARLDVLIEGEGRIDAWIDENQIPRCDVEYEDVLLEPSAVLKNIFRTLGLEGQVPHIDQPRTTQLADNLSRHVVDRFRRDLCRRAQLPHEL